MRMLWDEVMAPFLMVGQDLGRSVARRERKGKRWEEGALSDTPITMRMGRYCRAPFHGPCVLQPPHGTTKDSPGLSTTHWEEVSFATRSAKSWGSWAMTGKVS